jgi:proteasome alpha subunit
MEAFTRAPEDVSLRRLVSYGLSPQLKTNFEQIFSAPFLVELLLVEVGGQREQDLLLRLHFDGGFQFQTKGVIVAASQPDLEAAAQKWLSDAIVGKKNRTEVVDLLLQAWWTLMENKPFTDAQPPEAERQSGWRNALQDKVVEIGWLAREGSRRARFEMLTLKQLGL